MIKCRHLILLLSCLALQVLSHHDNVLQGPCAIFSCFGSSSDLRHYGSAFIKKASLALLQGIIDITQGKIVDVRVNDG
ncbi:hypothetical protein Y032_0118g736 [Ancylostoma ceylanicum]|uniref:Receptor ligand binding region domain-containing protein n=1 Tax=Ancylostoma ceylanicum TaxID=53326 RepID=A0A016TBK4_9BILA|nr:hypothetical protein Y032_0118g736 [Ancylostoma ceylanicum]